MQSNNTSGHPGVIYRPKKNKWLAMIGYKKRRIYLGEFDTLEQAVQVRKAAEKKYAEEAKKEARAGVPATSQGDDPGR